jgi:hypothetical protein
MQPASSSPLGDDANVKEASLLLQDFKDEQYWWCGKVSLAMWGGESLEVVLDKAADEGEGLADVQLGTLRELIDRQQDIRPYLAAELFEHYQKNIFHSMTHWSPERGSFGKDEFTPPIKTADEIWQLIDLDSIWIAHPAGYDADPKGFKIAGECHWDPEHGLGVKFRNWKIVEFCGSAN